MFKNIFLSSFVLTSSISAQASIVTLDQYQEDIGGGSLYSADSSLAQTFTAGFNQVLDRIEVYMDAWSGSPIYPTTITLRETDLGKPTGNDLASIFYDNGFGNSGWFSIDFTQEGIKLTQGEVYALIFSNDDPDFNDSNSNAVAATLDATSYLGGELWTTEGGNGWVVSNEFGNGADMTFRTFGNALAAEPEFNPDSKILSIPSVKIGDGYVYNAKLKLNNVGGFDIEGYSKTPSSGGEIEAKCTEDKIVLEKFEQITNGMTFEQVNSIIGCKGELLARDESVANYVWMGSVIPRIEIFFRNNSIFNKDFLP